ncbi:thiol reductase thioredoxin [Alteribacter lacisalsi]|uniref:Thiol reductase thioredoxin n=2 Tax=Alteribacter lacisalsi TaxID=2045244 RepID=A0A2W0HQL9_9BACI|nr:thiol reductase thioredoxin [Alteribacter lacisalsi]
MIKQNRRTVVFVHTAMCGTCRLAERFLTIVEPMFENVTVVKADISFFPALAGEHKIESVPCVLYFIDGNRVDRQYAVHSVSYLYDTFSRFTTAKEDHT